MPIFLPYNPDNLLFLGLADELMVHGNMEIYEATYEKLAFTIKEHDEKKEKAKTHIPEGEPLNLYMDFILHVFGTNSNPKSTL